MTEPPFQMVVKARVLRLKPTEGISDDELRWALREVERICQYESPSADYTVSAIENTNKTWYRQRPEGATFRTILSIRYDTHQIIVQAVLRRDENTYRRVKLIFDQAKDV